jgi:hypothetical protein
MCTSQDVHRLLAAHAWHVHQQAAYHDTAQGALAGRSYAMLQMHCATCLTEGLNNGGQYSSQDLYAVMAAWLSASTWLIQLDKYPS